MQLAHVSVSRGFEWKQIRKFFRKCSIKFSSLTVTFEIGGWDPVFVFTTRCFDSSSFPESHTPVFGWMRPTSLQECESKKNKSANLNLIFIHFSSSYHLSPTHCLVALWTHRINNSGFILYSLVSFFWGSCKLNYYVPAII